MLTLFYGWESKSSSKPETQKAPVPTDARQDSAARRFLVTFGARVVGLESGSRVVIAIPKANLDAGFAQTLGELCIRSYRVVYRDQPL